VCIPHSKEEKMDERGMRGGQSVMDVEFL